MAQQGSQEESESTVAKTRYPHLISELLKSTARLKLFRSGSNSTDMTSLEHPGVVQLNSPLLSFPREVRDMIWKHLMGGMIIHLCIDEKNGKKLKGSYCWAEDENCRLRCQAWLQMKGKTRWATIGICGFIFSCSQAYTESIKYLYELNIFDTRSPEVVCQLPKLSPSHKLNTIRSFTFCWTLASTPSLSRASREFCLEDKPDQAMKGCNRYQRDWIHTWSSLASMHSLEFLRVEMIIFGRNSTTNAREGADFEIVKMIKRPEKFLVVMEDESAQSLRGLVQAPNLTVLGIEEEENQMKKRKLDAV